MFFEKEEQLFLITFQAQNIHFKLKYNLDSVEIFTIQSKQVRVGKASDSKSDDLHDQVRVLVVAICTGINRRFEFWCKDINFKQKYHRDFVNFSNVRVVKASGSKADVKFTPQVRILLAAIRTGKRAGF